MKYSENVPPQIVHQGVDTLRTAHIITKLENYAKYENLLAHLSDLKAEAIARNAKFEFESGISFDFYTFGKFFIRPKGQGRYRYVIYNQDIEIFFSTVTFSANNFSTPQIVVDYRAKYLSLTGHQKAYDLVNDMLFSLLSLDTDLIYRDFLNTQLMRIDLATDIMGIEYTPLDKYRFQTNFKNQGHIEFKEHIQYNRLTGFSFGKGDYMMRIYNKRHQLNNDASKLWLTLLWVKNGYPEDVRPSVWRHETQMRRPYLKRFRPQGITDEVQFFFDMLPKLWTFSFSKVQFVDITNEQALKVMDAGYTPDALRQLFYRTKMYAPSSVWSLAGNWQGIQAPPPEDYGHYNQFDQSTAKRFYKAFISTAYKAGNGDPLNVLKIMDLVQNELETYNGITLHDYGENKLLSSFIDNAQFISQNGLVIDRDFKALSGKLYYGMIERFTALDDPQFDSNERRLAMLFKTDVHDLRNNINMYLTEINYDGEIQPQVIEYQMGDY